MDIIDEETGSHGRYSATVEGHAGEMTYSRSSPHLIIVDHTAVPDALRGKGVGQALAAHAVDAARKGRLEDHSALPVHARPGATPSRMAGCRPGLRRTIKTDRNTQALLTNLRQVRERAYWP